MGTKNFHVTLYLGQYDLKGNKIREFNSIAETALKTNSDRTGISAYLNSNKAELGKTYKGFIYKVLQK